MTSPQILAEEFEKIYEKDLEIISSYCKIICPLCSFEQINKNKIIVQGMFGSNILRIKCEKCETIFGPLSFLDLNNNEITRLYNIVYSFYREGGDRRQHQFEVFNKLNPEKSKTYLNYACGIEFSKDIDLFAENGYDVFGYDIVIPDDQVNNRIFNKNNFPTNLDGIFSIDFIEHITNPLQQFSEWNEILKIGGVMLHDGLYDSFIYNGSYFHCLYCSKNGLEEICRKTGFELYSYGSYVSTFMKIKNLD